jgi:hypothetical protein
MKEIIIKINGGCTYCSKVFKSQGEVLFHENTWCKYEHKRKQDDLEKYIKYKKK